MNGKGSRLIKLNVRVPEGYVKLMEYLVHKGYFSSKSELVRVAVDKLLEKEFKRNIIIGVYNE